jgi:hypothetical protein
MHSTHDLHDTPGGDVGVARAARSRCGTRPRFGWRLLVAGGALTLVLGPAACGSSQSEVGSGSSGGFAAKAGSSASGTGGSAGVSGGRGGTNGGMEGGGRGGSGGAASGRGGTTSGSGRASGAAAGGGGAAGSGDMCPAGGLSEGTPCAAATGSCCPGLRCASTTQFGSSCTQSDCVCRPSCGISDDCDTQCCVQARSGDVTDRVCVPTSTCI